MSGGESPANYNYNFNIYNLNIKYLASWLNSNAFSASDVKGDYML